MGRSTVEEEEEAKKGLRGCRRRKLSRANLSPRFVPFDLVPDVLAQAKLASIFSERPKQFEPSLVELCICLMKMPAASRSQYLGPAANIQMYSPAALIVSVPRTTTRLKCLGDT